MGRQVKWCRASIEPLVSRVYRRETATPHTPYRGPRARARARPPELVAASRRHINTPPLGGQGLRENGDGANWLGCCAIVSKCQSVLLVRRFSSTATLCDRAEILQVANYSCRQKATFQPATRHSLLVHAAHEGQSSRLLMYMHR